MPKDANYQQPPAKCLVGIVPRGGCLLLPVTMAAASCTCHFSCYCVLYLLVVWSAACNVKGGRSCDVHGPWLSGSEEFRVWLVVLVAAARTYVTLYQHWIWLYWCVCVHAVFVYVCVSFLAYMKEEWHVLRAIEQGTDTHILSGPVNMMFLCCAVSYLCVRCNLRHIVFNVI